MQLNTSIKTVAKEGNTNTNTNNINTITNNTNVNQAKEDKFHSKGFKPFLGGEEQRFQDALPHAAEAEPRVGGSGGE